MTILKINQKVTMQELESYKLERGSLIKAVVDVEKKVIVIGCELHVDGEQELLEKGSNQSMLWGINLYPQYRGKSTFLEYDSMINVRPRDNNKTRGVDNPRIRKLIKEIVLTYFLA